MIVRMQHLDLVCVADEREQTLERLREIGAVHLDLGAVSGGEIAAADHAYAEAERAIRLIVKMRGKMPLDEINLHEHSVEYVLNLDADRETLTAELERLEKEIRYFAPYGDFDPVLAKKVIAGIGGDASEVAAKLGLPERMPEMRLSKLQEKFDRVENRIRIDCAKMSETDDVAIARKFPALKDCMAFVRAKRLLEDHGQIAVISGWIPETKVALLKSAAKDWGLLLRPPAAGEVPPTLIEPPKAFRPMKALFEGLGVAPAYTEADVSVPFMCYFSLFFAMLVGDGAYGAIFLAATLLLRKKLPKAWFVLLAVFSSATIGWGLLSNTWFGAGIPWCANWPTVTWLADPSYNHMMLLCFTIGVSHLMLARIWNGVCKINDTAAIAEFGWAGVLLMMYLVTNSIVDIFPKFPDWGFWVGGISIACVFLFTVKPSELKTRGAELGMLPLNIMSALGDIISYVRLFAVGLASVKVAENFNSMAIELFKGADDICLKLVMAIAMVAIMIFGHVLNLMMAGLSILVHAVRLNTLEFSNHKGITWSGYAFNPFKKGNAK